MSTIDSHGKMSQKGIGIFGQEKLRRQLRKMGSSLTGVKENGLQGDCWLITGKTTSIQRYIHCWKCSFKSLTFFLAIKQEVPG